MDKLAILIPAYNEEVTISKVVKDTLAVTSDIKGTSVYVYDNNSSDNTVELAERAGATVRHEYSQGKGAVIRRMFREIDAEAYIMIDADDTYPVEVIPDMYSRIVDRGIDMVVGDRLSSTYFEENKRPFHNVGNSLVRSLINFLFKTDIQDILTGYRGFSFNFVKTFPVLSRGFEIETEMSIHATEKHMLVENLVVTYRDRPDGSESKLNTYGDGLRVLKTVINLYRGYHPFAFYSIFSIISLIISATLFFGRVWIPYVQTHTVDNTPSLIVSMIFFVLSVIAFFSGSILAAIQTNDKRNFELSVIDASERLKDLRNEGKIKK
ncbi:glycosyltransferase family 2 protein [Leuconostoc mesenteroides]|uniref:glycosyltransferase family 2 protein n=1 Tax=Leuconostoc mesenteroides TaxID=1245 RepID=UPI0004618911|nr:glycosyltransferase family 2 protein [Leuconostoc mesenteroides]KDA52128.1 Glycosyltransferase [Leuconostoc mesenteroides subsp. cremoris T26]ORI36596.1 glycosyl transferase [Leuconostoc mesenteroides subsp. cremoris]ORI37042.1 glycosyl transferase [Leuconostoc mesenteroides subsp. cremoris]ORI40845.1 glycosyl transferase [Leuconostoc mesenteroides subsp. cremoris]ORI41836.1 glycosyl transferase [Leuconostoc mesenteroides subsp. cremoris]